MVSKIFEILAGIKKTSRITKAAQLESVEKIVNEVSTGLVNPVEAYVMLDYLKKVTEEAMKEIKASTLTYIQTEGENEAFNVQLGLVSKKDYNYQFFVFLYIDLDQSEWLCLRFLSKVVDRNVHNSFILPKCINRLSVCLRAS